MSRLAACVCALVGCGSASEAPPAAAPPPADCAAVAQKLAAFELPPGGSPQQRAALVDDKARGCTAAHVSAAEGACIAVATDRWGAARCAPSLFPGMQSSGSGDCPEVIARLTAAMPASVAGPSAAPTLAVLRESCDRDAWPDELKGCVLAAPAGQLPGMQACTDKMPKALQDKLTARLMDAMQRPAR